MIYPNPFTIAPWTSTKKGWVITNNTNVGRIFNTSNTKPRIKHYILSLQNVLRTCPGCHLKSTIIQTKKCYFIATANIFYNIQVDSKYRIYAKLDDILKALKTSHILTQTVYKPNSETLP